MSPSPNTPSRRSIAKGAAWSAPALVLATPALAYAGSGAADLAVITGMGGGQPYANGEAGSQSATLSNVGAKAFTSSAIITIAVSEFFTNPTVSGSGWAVQSTVDTPGATIYTLAYGPAIPAGSSSSTVTISWTYNKPTSEPVNGTWCAQIQNDPTGGSNDSSCQTWSGNGA